MILVLCEKEKKPFVFPTGQALVASAACGSSECKATGPGMCVNGVEDGDVVCLGFFTDACATVGCDCTEVPCVHLDPEGPTLEPVLQRWLTLVDPEVVRIERGKEATRTRLLGHIGAYLAEQKARTSGKEETLLERISRYISKDQREMFRK